MSKAEKFIEKNTRNCSQLHYNSACTLRHCITPDQAKEAVEITREEIYNWLDNNLALYDACNCFLEKCRLLKDLKKAMKDE